ncbi:hypothetical protein GIB67_042376, partial [Kingdonia uniflora]
YLPRLILSFTVFSFLPECLYFLNIHSKYSYYPYVRKLASRCCHRFHNFWKEWKKVY